MGSLAPMSLNSVVALPPREISLLFTNAAKDVDAYDGPSKETHRNRALETAKKLVATLEKPEDIVMRYAWEVQYTSFIQAP